ncbi:MAG: exosortase-dependent surface protein XDP2 [Verrucomicrobiota bacterium JB023]|nr:exosortase-dependent surface protein XDP2 [Verrucomicrobiota bacterium JB023]
MKSLRPLTLLMLCGLSSASGAISVTGIGFTVPSTGNNGTRTGTSSSQAFIDDFFLTSVDTVSDAGVSTSYSVADGDIVLAFEAIVRSGANSVNAEFGDQDTDEDGHPNPFAEVGVGYPNPPIPSSVTESTDPAIQNAAITAAFSSYSLNEGVDGEGPAYTYDVFFRRGVIDNDAGSDGVPEFMFLERGFNSSYELRAIIGGTKDAPIYSSVISVSTSDQTGTGLYVNSNEIGSAQQLAAYAVDASDFGIAAGQAIYGLSVTSTNGTGADMTFQGILAPEDRQVSSPFIPEPSSFGLLLLAAGSALLRRQRS